MYLLAIFYHLFFFKLQLYLFSIGYLPSDLEEWKEFLTLYAQSCVVSGMVTCLTCNKQHSSCVEFPHTTSSKPWNVSLLWETICRVALLQLDSIKVLEILQTLDIPNGAFSSDFYKSVMRSYLLNKQQRYIFSLCCDTSLLDMILSWLSASFLIWLPFFYDILNVA